MNDNTTDTPGTEIVAGDKILYTDCQPLRKIKVVDYVLKLERERDEARLERDQLREALDIRREIQTRP